MGPTCSWMPSPSRVSVCALLAWFETVMTTGPAPTLFGGVVTRALVMTPVSCRGTGGRGLLAKSFPPPHPPSTMATAAATPVTRVALIPRPGTLSPSPIQRIGGAESLEGQLHDFCPQTG